MYTAYTFVCFCSKIRKTTDEIESEKLAKGIHECVMEMIKKREEKIVTGEADSFGNDFLGLLVNAFHDSDDKNRLSVEDLVDECKTFYFVGQEMTKSLLTWTVLLLSIHSDWQEKARREVIEVFGDKNPHSEGISKLKTVSKTAISDDFNSVHYQRLINYKFILLTDELDHL
ncbi:cytochrome P450 CYP749A22-like [Durio zibethinus]|uniref:Cytochrome P450 CYP749A22-like n=1 Tax=Durio zibethinus TaxID=66656 RepID=A0A6P5XEG2_DURZI|nr:cytochrome P450 CYP749A22-like [Durio zibethinus]